MNHDPAVQKLSQYLTPDERLIWSGQPIRGLNFRPRDIAWLSFGLFWIAFTTFFEALLWFNAAPGFAHAWTASFGSFGIFLVGGRFTIDVLIRAKTFYGVTSKRVLILQEFPGTEIRTIKLDAVSDLRLVQRIDGTGTIAFGFLPLSSDIRGFGWHPIAEKSQEYWGFASIPEVRAVFELMRNMQIVVGEYSPSLTRQDTVQLVESDREAAQRLGTELVRDERLIWAGRPRRGLILRASDLFLIPFGILFTGSAVLLVFALLIPEEPLPLPILIFGMIYAVPVISSGLFLLGGRIIVDSMERASTYYALTTHRALILRLVPVKELRSLHLHRIASVSVSSRQDGSGTIAFHNFPYAPRFKGYSPRGFLQPVDSVFELIPSAIAVSALIPDIEAKTR